jgi:hypothetical protein
VNGEIIMMNTINNLNKKTKVILLAVCLVVMVGMGSVVTACNMVKSDTDTSVDKVVATESATEPTEQATEVATEQPTEEETEEPTEQATEKPTEEVTEKATEDTTEEATEKPTKKKDKSESDKDEDKDKENKNDNEENTVVTTTTTTGGNQTNNNNNTNNNTSTGNNTTNNNTQTNTNTNNNTTTNNTGNTTSKVWHEAEYKTVHHPAETKKVWVIDQEGYTYEEPVYETHGRAICNTCGADITNNVGDHGYNHMINGENASYRVEDRQVQTGSTTITVEEKGHWETQVVKEAWDEQVLIKEAGYY